MEIDFVQEVEIQLDDDSESADGLILLLGDSFTHPVKWVLAIDNQEGRIKGMCVLMPDQELILKINTENIGDGELKTYIFKITAKNMETENPELNIDSEIKPEDLVLNLKNIIKIDDDNYTADADGCLFF